MLDRLRTWLDAREDARRRRESQQGSNSVGDARTAAAAAPTPSRRAGLRPRAVAGAKPSATATAASDDAYVLVTVGTTKFEALIEAIDTPEFAEALAERGYTRLVVQKGAGTYAPTRLLARGRGAAASSFAGRLRVETFDFVPSLAALLSGAALVVSHAGSGSVFEALSFSRPLIVVPNPILMDNHQAELAEHLAREGVAACAEPEAASLAAAVRAVGGGSSALRPYVPGDPSGIVRRLDWLMGRREDEKTRRQ